ncbi:sensor histidine kinase [Propionibacterium australiense]|uniref:histidine kinase n=1 Tax=Propionibacterium australiense TaxID=119981 RepID=A0A383S6X7_9ACTN|nr:histidine kinase [Propionibacterium australiense]RLP09685.1 hypothetical protein D7U36_07820 [Propionibacterium australiense]RLP12386.1 hypothetical protein D9T14_00600 [Propionibacterium australiense]SYZ33593.1 Histidine kinase [Propionibacterium australiense]VEH89506.1 Sensor histidine kinase desK [Propionibacterium australiense]
MLAVLLATPIAVFGTLNFTIPVLLLVVAFAVVDVSLRAGIHATVWISCVGFALHVFGSLTPWDAFPVGATQGLINVVPVAVLLCFGIALGLLLRSFEKRRHDDQKVINRLRHATEMEKELLLSEERARSARELHDGLGHRLTLVSMSLELAERMRGIDVDQAWEEIHTAKDTTSDALAEMRMWVRALNPVRDSEARGLAALELIAESFRGTGLTVDVSGDEASDRELTSDDEVALLIYRAVQEGLTNALRHSRARTVRIFLAVKERRMELAVINDFGSAATVGQPELVPDFGFGLRGISDRAAVRGGSVHACRIDGEFHLDVVVPLGGSGGTDRKETT